MGTLLLRTTPDSEVYVVWSTVTDLPEFAGTREETESYLLDVAVRRARAIIDVDLDLAADTGTSVKHRLPGQAHSTGSWKDDGLQYGATRWLDRARLHEFIELWMEEKDEEAEKLLKSYHLDD